MDDAGQVSSTALRPLMSVAAGVGAAAATSAIVPCPGPVTAHWLLLAAGVAAAVVGLSRRPRGLWQVWLAAGLALGGGRGLQARAASARIEHLVTVQPQVAVRIRAVVREGWQPTRWGFRTLVDVVNAHHRDESVPLRDPASLEVRGAVVGSHLSPPGTVITALALLRGEARRPVLVVASAQLLETVGHGGLHALRDRLARSLLGAAATDVGRIRAAELAAALALGRRDLIPMECRQGWRRSGLAHMLATSGLHVGLVAGLVWMLGAIAGVSPRTSRLMVLVALPAYAVLAGLPPSATRAALMGMTYLAARLLGRALLPMAAVLIAAAMLLLFDPLLALEASFQLTVVITAALVRWAPPLTAAIPGPRWLAAALAIPVVAQITALPMVAFHFRTAIPGSAAANLAVPWALAPTLTAAVAATMVAPWWPAAAGVLLDIVALGRTTLWTLGGPGRAVELVPPSLPPLLAIALAVAGWAAVHSGSRARYGAMTWILLLLGWTGWWLWRPQPIAPRVTLLEVREGLAAVATAGAGGLLFDGGRPHRQTRELLADARVRRLAAVLASHPDEDHVRGLARVLRTLPVERLLLPADMTGEASTVKLLRIARQQGVRVQPVTRGLATTVAGSRLVVLWPPAGALELSGNQRSLVARLELGGAPVLFTADIDATIEERLAHSSRLACGVLVVPHHGSRSSTSPVLLDATRPRVALIPAGPDNPHHHPSREVLERLRRRSIPFRAPILHGRCGAVVDEHGHWRPFP